MEFVYENLEVWNRAVDFAVKVIELVETIDTECKHLTEVKFLAEN